MPSFLKRHDNKQSFPVGGKKPSMKDYSTAQADNKNRKSVNAYAEKLRAAKEDQADFELNDIFEEVTAQNVKHKAAENIEYTLKREGLLPKGYHVVIPEGGYNYNLEDSEDESGYISGSFEIFAPDMNTIVAYGSFDSTVQMQELLDINLGITEVNI